MTFPGSASLRLLVVDAYDAAGRAALRGAGGTEAGRLYARLLGRVRPDAEVVVMQSGEGEPGLPELAGFDGVVWTGSNLSVAAESLPVRRHVELVRATFAAGVPAFGSCYAAQLAVAAAGGSCRTNPRGREFGVARDVALTDAGRAHPMFAGKPPVFDAWTSHADEIATLPPGGTLLASNAWSRVQAVSVRSGGAEFWAVQYHPEYDPHEISCLAALRADELVAQGTFANAAAVAAWRESLLGPPGARATVPPSLVDPSAAECEVSNWIERLVLPGRRR